MTLTKKEKQTVRLQICSLMDERCDSCEKKRQMMREYSRNGGSKGRNELQHYCNTQCPVGKRLQTLSRMLLSEEMIPKKKPKKPTKKGNKTPRILVHCRGCGNKSQRVQRPGGGYVPCQKCGGEMRESPRKPGRPKKPKKQRTAG